MKIANVIKKFNIPGNLINIKQNSSGNINRTYIAEYVENNERKRYLIQQINNYVFKNPYEVMDNINGITSYFKKKLEEIKDTKHQVLEVIKTIDNKTLLVVQNENGIEEFYRAYNFIENAICYDNTDDLEIIRNVGKAFGNFQKVLDKYEIETVYETIKDFHNTKKRYFNFKENIKKDEFNRVKEVKKEIEYILNRENISTIIIGKLENMEIPYRVTHNDTKVNNVMMNEETKDYITVIDLDTVMPGSSLFDYGDGIRSTAANSDENELNLKNVYLDNKLFEVYTDGYLSELAPYIKEEELKLMGNSILTMTIELALRFLEDYITGDKYFKCNYDKHNLDRARNQIMLANDIENKMEYINDYIKKTYVKYINNK